MEKEIEIKSIFDKIKEDKKILDDDIIQHMTEIKLPIRDRITDDFVLAYLDNYDRQMIMEITSDAEGIVSIINNFKINILRKKIDKMKDIKEIEKLQKQFKLIDKLTEDVYNSYMIRIYMIIILNRNKKDNPIFEYIFGKRKEEENLKDTKINTIEKIKENL